MERQAEVIEADEHHGQVDPRDRALQNHSSRPQVRSRRDLLGTGEVQCPITKTSYTTILLHDKLLF